VDLVYARWVVLHEEAEVAGEYEKLRQAFEEFKRAQNAQTEREAYEAYLEERAKRSGPQTDYSDLIGILEESMQARVEALRGIDETLERLVRESSETNQKLERTVSLIEEWMKLNNGERERAVARGRQRYSPYRIREGVDVYELPTSGTRLTAGEVATRLGITVEMLKALRNSDKPEEWLILNDPHGVEWAEAEDGYWMLASELAARNG